MTNLPLMARQLLAEYCPEWTDASTPLIEEGEAWLVIVDVLSHAAANKTLTPTDANMGLELAQKRVIFGTKISTWFESEMNRYLNALVPA